MQARHLKEAERLAAQLKPRGHMTPYRNCASLRGGLLLDAAHLPRIPSHMYWHPPASLLYEVTTLPGSEWVDAVLNLGAG